MRDTLPARRLASPRTATLLAAAVAAVAGLLVLAEALSGALTLDRFKAVSGTLLMVVLIAAAGVVVARHQSARSMDWLLATSPPDPVHGTLEPRHALAWIRDGGA